MAPTDEHRVVVAAEWADQQRPDLVGWLRRLRGVYLAGMLGGTHHEVYPRVDRGSRENFLYFTLAAALNVQRASEGLWRSALATYTDPQTRFVFLPEHVGPG